MGARFEALDELVFMVPLVLPYFFLRLKKGVRNDVTIRITKLEGQNNQKQSLASLIFGVDWLFPLKMHT